MRQNAKTQELEVPQTNAPPVRPGSYGSIHHDILFFPCEVRFVTLGYGNPCGTLPHLSPSPSRRRHHRHLTLCACAYKAYVDDDHESATVAASASHPSPARLRVALALAFAWSYNAMTAATTT